MDWQFCQMKNLSSSVDKMSKLWDLETCTEIVSFEGHEYEIWAIALTDDKQHFLTG